MAKDSREDASRAILDDAMQEACLVETMARILRMPRGKFFKLLDYIFSKEKKAIAWELDPNYDGTVYDETYIGENEREVVPEEDVTDGGPLSGTVKIKVMFGGGHSGSATGVLIRDKDGRTVMTAGHVLFSKKWGYAKCVTIHAGVGSISGTVEARDGMYAVVSSAWSTKGLRKNDLGFLRLREPFDIATVTPLETCQTPLSAAGTIVGFSKDFPPSAPGKYLGKSKSLTIYDPLLTAGMVEHEGDTEKGASGGPVLDEMGRVMALICGWAYKSNKAKINVAVAIDREGNDVTAFTEVLAYMAKHAGKHMDDNVHEVGDADFMNKEDGNNINMKMIGKVEGFDALAFTW